MPYIKKEVSPEYLLPIEPESCNPICPSYAVGGAEPQPFPFEMADPLPSSAAPQSSA